MLNSAIKTLLIGGFLFGLLQTAYADPCEKEKHLCDKYFKDHIDLITIKSGEKTKDAKNKIDKKIKQELSNIKDLMTKDEIANFNNPRTFLNKIKSYDVEINKQLISLKKITKDKDNEKSFIAKNKIKIKPLREKEKKLESFIEENYGSAIFKPILLIYNGLFCDEECKKDENSYINKMASLKKTQNDIYKLNDHIKKSYKSIKDSTVDEAQIKIQKKELQKNKQKIKTASLHLYLLMELKDQIDHFHIKDNTIIAEVIFPKSIKNLNTFLGLTKISNLDLTMDFSYYPSVQDQIALSSHLSEIDLSSIRSLKLEVKNPTGKEGYADFLSKLKKQIFENTNAFTALELKGSIALYCLFGGINLDLTKNDWGKLKKLKLIKKSNIYDDKLNLHCGSDYKKTFSEFFSQIVGRLKLKELIFNGSFDLDYFEKNNEKYIFQYEKIDKLHLMYMPLTEVITILSMFRTHYQPPYKKLDYIILETITDIKPADIDKFKVTLKNMPPAHVILKNVYSHKLENVIKDIYRKYQGSIKTLKINDRLISRD